MTAGRMNPFRKRFETMRPCDRETQFNLTKPDAPREERAGVLAFVIGMMQARANGVVQSSWELFELSRLLEPLSPVRPLLLRWLLELEPDREVLW